LNACERLIPPLPRIWKRFAAPRLVFILGTYPLLYFITPGDARPGRA